MQPTQNNNLIIKSLGIQDYETCYQNMQAHITQRIELQKETTNTLLDQKQIADELWLVTHPSVYTLGQAGDPKHILNSNNTPIVKTDRGGQVTWHGEGQLVAYFLFDLNRLGWHVRELVSNCETIICKTLSPYLPEHLNVKPNKEAPGVYVFNQGETELTQTLGKIASLGFKIKKGFSYHGIAININCDLKHFKYINPCGYKNMTMLNLNDISTNPPVSLSEIEKKLTDEVLAYYQNRIQP